MHALMNDTGVTWRKSSPCATHQSGRPPPLSSRISSIAKIMTHVHSSGRSPNFIVHLSSIQISPATFERWRQECLVASAQISSQGFPLRWKAPTILIKKNRCQHMPIKLFRTIRITSAQQYHQAYRASLHLRSVFCLCSLVLMVSFGEPEEECIICCSLLNVSSTREQILYPAVVNRSKAKENCRSPHRFQAKHFHSALEMRTVA
jgi:hypothetical protein